ncbi:MAG: type II toxin-antitoxin system VapC family toxin [Gemmatimonadaceae bacterium]
MNLYVETSAVLAWLLGEPSQHATLEALRSAEHVFTSALTTVECARGLARARTSGRITAVEELAALRLLDEAEPRWHVHDLSDAVLSRARGRFPVEPVRTLDAFHLATVQVLQEALGAITVLSFDDRVRENARALSMSVTPA